MDDENRNELKSSQVAYKDCAKKSVSKTLKESNHQDFVTLFEQAEFLGLRFCLAANQFVLTDSPSEESGYRAIHTTGIADLAEAKRLMDTLICMHRFD